jgi:GNAT superfamily N-acetyltransferase
MPSPLAIQVFTGRDPALKSRIADLAQLRMTVFREYPYLYDGSLAYEEEYLRTYLECADIVVVLVTDGARVVGASTGLPLSAETEAFQRPFLAQNLDPGRVFYGGESVLLPEYRGQGLYRSFFTQREAHARSFGHDRMAFCAVVRPDSHPRRPADYVPLDTIWQKFGYTKHPKLTTTYPWKDLDEPSASDKEMVFWMKPLN